MAEPEPDYVYLETVDGKSHTKTVPAGNGRTAARNAMTDEWTEVDGKTWVRRDALISVHLQLASDDPTSLVSV